jgi:hypothetical protein
MPNTYEPIATTVLTGTASNLTISNIPSTYTDLRIVFSGLVTTSNAFYLRFNGDTNANYSYTYFYSYGAGVGTSTSGNGSEILMDAVLGQKTDQFFTYELDILNYTSSANKNILHKFSASYNTSSGGAVTRYVNGWRNSSAVSSIVITRANGTSTIATGSRLTVWGILKA